MLQKVHSTKPNTLIPLVAKNQCVITGNQELRKHTTREAAVVTMGTSKCGDTWATGPRGALGC